MRLKQYSPHIHKDQAGTFEKSSHVHKHEKSKHKKPSEPEKSKQKLDFSMCLPSQKDILKEKDKNRDKRDRDKDKSKNRHDSSSHKPNKDKSHKSSHSSNKHKDNDKYKEKSRGHHHIKHKFDKHSKEHDKKNKITNSSHNCSSKQNEDYKKNSEGSKIPTESLKNPNISTKKVLNLLSNTNKLSPLTKVSSTTFSIEKNDGCSEDKSDTSVIHTPVKRQELSNNLVSPFKFKSEKKLSKITQPRLSQSSDVLGDILKHMKKCDPHI